MQSVHQLFFIKMISFFKVGQNGINLNKNIISREKIICPNEGHKKIYIYLYNVLVIFIILYYTDKYIVCCADCTIVVWEKKQTKISHFYLFWDDKNDEFL